MAHALIMDQEAIITDLRVSEVEGKKVFEPVVEVLNTGVVTQVRPSVSADRERVWLDLEFESRDVKRPIATSTVEGYPIALPECSFRVFSRNFSASCGEVSE